MDFFTTYWTNKTWKRVSEMNFAGDLLDHTAGNFLRSRGIKPGDAVYVITVFKGKLFIACKIVVDQIVKAAEARKIIGQFDLWDADDHIITSESTPLNWNFELPENVTEKLRCLDSKGKVSGLTYASPGELDNQTLRGIRQMTPESADLIDQHIGSLRKIKVGVKKPKKSLWNTSTGGDESIVSDFESFPEGNKKTKFVTYYERDPKNRKEAIRIHGCTCRGCDMNFEKRYGPHGKDFIHVHHLKPVAQFEKPKKIDPESDLTVLCPNCHAMVHKKKDETLSVAEVREMIAKNRRMQ